MFLTQILKYPAPAFLFVIALASASITGSQAVGSAGANAASTRQSLERERLAGSCRGFDFSGKVTDGYFVQHGGGKVKVKIPVDYLLFPETGSTFTENGDGSANFNFHRDTLQPYPRREMQGKIVAGKEEWISFLVTDLIEINAIAKGTMNRLSGRKTASNEPPFPEKEASKGLFQIQLPSRRQPDWEKKTLYFGRDASAVTDVISCSVSQPNRYPHCEHITRLDGYDVKILYPLDQLQNWTMTKRNVQNLLECITE